ncbi:hypothetical protein PoB_003266800 [Plakobranchus ocellatus]|uniref:Uncharacterized protein n=1 Tax=Plakobranchus ocellatus TaxID=259542 RepID=A0AAV4AI03_9GAST|nr:hypothetical protein PoB_003266800 [Plakobranchus ocellatus]
MFSKSDRYALHITLEALRSNHEKVEGTWGITSEKGVSIGGTFYSKPALRSAGTLLLRVRAPPPPPSPNGGPQSLRSPCCGLAVQLNQL